MTGGRNPARPFSIDRARNTRNRLQTLYTVAAATLAAIIPLVILSGFWVKSELDKGRNDTDGYLAAHARSLTYQVDGEVREQLSALQTLAALPSLDMFDRGSLEPAAERMMAARPGWKVLGLVDVATGEHVFAAGGQWPQSEEARALTRVKDKQPVVVTRPAAAGREDILLYVPVVRPGGVALAVVAQVAVATLDDIVGHQAAGAPLVTVVDEQGRVLGRSRDPARHVGQPVDPSFRDMIRGSGGLYQGVALDGEDVIGAYVRSALTGWTMTVSTNRVQLDAASRAAVLATVGAVTLAILLVAILGAFVFHTIMQRRISNERLRATRALGELDARLLATTQEALDDQRKSASEREVLLREIYHRVKNNLQIVQSLLRLGSRDLKQEQREPFEAAVRRIGAMARVHTLLYNSPDLASIDFKDYLVELMRELSEGFSAEERSIEHVLEASSLRLPLDTAVPLAFIAVEILTNAFRHAFPSGGPGRINVAADHEDGIGRLWIEDNGVGLTVDQKTKRRLGLTIVAKLVQQIGGKLEEPTPGSSRFVITFPITPAAAEAAIAAV